MKCTECGMEYRDTAKFCPYCGKPNVPGKACPEHAESMAEAGNDAGRNARGFRPELRREETPARRKKKKTRLRWGRIAAFAGILAAVVIAVLLATGVISFGNGTQAPVKAVASAEDINVTVDQISWAPAADGTVMIVDMTFTNGTGSSVSFDRVAECTCTQEGVELEETDPPEDLPAYDAELVGSPEKTVASGGSTKVRKCYLSEGTGKNYTFTVTAVSEEGNGLVLIDRNIAMP